MLIMEPSNNNFIYHASYEDWGVIFYIMEKHGWAVVRMYIYKDDVESSYLIGLSVDEEHRHNHLATKLIKHYENIAKELGVEYSYLSVEKDEWMHEWYTKIGYVDFENNNDVESQIWMRKILNKI